MADVLFTASDLAEMQALNAANLPHTADVEVKTSTDNGGGEYVDTWSVEQNDVPCRFSPATAPQEQLTAGAVREIKDFYVVFAVDVLIPSDRRLVVTHDNPGIPSPITLEVTGSSAHSYEMERKVTATLVGGL